MSKLFDTLEQIRRNESYHVPSDNRRKTAAKQGKQTLLKRLLTAILLLGLAALFFSQLRFPEELAKSTPRGFYLGAGGAIAPTPEVLTLLGHPESIALEDETTAALINTGVRHVENHDHWRGIYIFSKILAKNPANVDTLINISVALAELGLTEPAKRYLGQALQLAPENRALQNNIAILKSAGALSKDFPGSAPGRKS